jgi:hypothetical protein
LIAHPHNDHECLVPATEQVIAAVQAGHPALVELAERFDDTDALAAWFRTLPQRDDDGDPADGPKVSACRPAQRLDFDNPFPNCFERACKFSGAAEMIDPHRVYRLATVQTPTGLHTFPTRDGEPVILDPIQNRNALRAGLAEDVATRRLRLERLIGLDETRGVRGDLARARRAKELGHPTWVDGKPIDEAIAIYERALARYQEQLDALPRNSTCLAPSAPVVLTPEQAVDWVADAAMRPAPRFVDGVARVQNGHRAMRGVLVLHPICVAEVHDVAFLLALAEREAHALGAPGLKIVHSTAKAIDALDRIAAEKWLAEQASGSDRASARNASPFEIKIGDYHLRPNVPLLGSLAKVGGRLAGNVGLEALRVKLASLGIGTPILRSVERELNREGLSLGALAKPPPMLGSLDAMTPEAIAGRWLANKL